MLDLWSIMDRRRKLANENRPLWANALHPTYDLSNQNCPPNPVVPPQQEQGSGLSQSSPAAEFYTSKVQKAYQTYLYYHSEERENPQLTRIFAQ